MRKAEEVRRKSLETFSETKKRKQNEEDGECSKPSSKRGRNSGSDTLVYLREKAETDREIKNEEMLCRKKDLELRAAQQNINTQQQQQFYETLTESMHQQQQQSQQMRMLMAHMVQNINKK